jgi:hypothetical protein
VSTDIASNLLWRDKLNKIEPEDKLEMIVLNTAINERITVSIL